MYLKYHTLVTASSLLDCSKNHGGWAGEHRVDKDLPQAARVRAAGPEEDHGLQRDALEGQRSRSHGGLHPDEPEQRLEAAMN